MLIPGPSSAEYVVSDSERDAKALAFDRLLAHLRSHHEVQNIDLMNLAGFCRNCLADWYREALAESGNHIDKEAARAFVLGMPSAEWKQRYQREASADALTKFSASHAPAQNPSP
jgi:uncharacterized protein